MRTQVEQYERGSTPPAGSELRLELSTRSDADRILFVTNMWADEERPWYGSFIVSQARSLEDLGLAVDTLYVRGYLGHSTYARSLLPLARTCRDPRWSLVHAHFGHTALMAGLSGRRSLVVSYCGDDLLGTPRASGGRTLKSRIEVATFRQVARVAAATITKSDEMQAVLPKRVRRRNHVIPNGVDLSQFSPLPRVEARTKLGWPLDVPIVLFVGNPQLPRKNHELAAQTLVKVRARRYPSAELRIAWGIPPEAVPVHMAGADCLLFTSLWEGSPNTVKEAMAMELPVVTVPVGDVTQRLKDLPACTVVEPDPTSLAAAVELAIAHGRVPEARQAVTPLSLQAVARQVVELYESVLGRPLVMGSSPG